MHSSVKKSIPPAVAIITALAILAALIISIRASAEGTVLVSGNTSAGENQAGWLFGRDTNTATTYAFSHVKASLGIGSLYIGPIINTNSGGAANNDPNSDKFIAEYFPASLPVASFHSFSYDYLIGAGGDMDDVDQFYVNIYANIDDSDVYYDCRYDYVAKEGSKDSFRKVVILEQDAPTNVVQSQDSRISCPQTLQQMPAGSHIRAIALNVGDTTDADMGLDAYIDNVELALVGDATTFNFEPRPRTKEDCSGDKWKQYRFRNQGQCVKSI